MKSKNIEKYFKNKKITQMGLGGFGRAVAEAEFLLKYGADLIITDFKEESTFPKQIKRLKKALKKYEKNGAKLSFFLGKNQKKNHFKNRDLVLYPNGVKLNDPLIKYAKKNSKIVSKSAAYLFWIIKKEFGEKVKTIGVTGTKGKSTTTALVETVLKTSGYDVYSCGNIRNSVNLPILEKISEGNFLLAELDSWSLQGFGDLKISPNYAIFTNFFNDHQNYYHSMKKYFLDKSNIFKFQKSDDIAIFTNQSAEACKKYFNKRVNSKKIITRTYKLPKWKFSILGKHNKNNIAQVIELGKILKLSLKNMKNALENFKAVEGRQEFLGIKRGVYFWNDNNSTTPESSILTMQTLKKEFPKSKIFLIGGGKDKNFDYQDFSKIIQKNIEKSFLFDGTATNKIIKNFTPKYKSFEVVSNMKYALDSAFKLAKKGDIILLSPGAASFGTFKNEYDRNDQFVNFFKKLK